MDKMEEDSAIDWRHRWQNIEPWSQGAPTPNPSCLARRPGLAASLPPRYVCRGRWENDWEDFASFPLTCYFHIPHPILPRRVVQVLVEQQDGKVTEWGIARLGLLIFLEPSYLSRIEIPCSNSYIQNITKLLIE